MLDYIKYSNTVIDALGGTSKVAKMRNIKMPSVCSWRVNGIPDVQLEVLRLTNKEVFKALDKDCKKS